MARAGTAPAVRVMLASAKPAGIETLAGNANAGLLLERETCVPPEGAADVRLTAQTLEVDANRAGGLQRMDATPAD
jgi:hypothetical protein